jgi:hypothetical protein
MVVYKDNGAWIVYCIAIVLRQSTTKIKIEF